MAHLPPAFLQSLQGLPGFEPEAFLQAHETGAAVVSVRFNPQKPLPTAPEGSPHQHPVAAVPWCATGRYLAERPLFTLDPLFHAGAYYVQEASSMFLEQALKQTVDLAQPLKVLDLCAAPGGKSTHLQSLLSRESLLVSNEVIKARAAILTENLTKWGAANVVVTNNDPVHFQRLPGFFDVLVVDAPCSGSGLFRKDPDAISEWSEEAVQHCSLRQQRILTDALPCLREGGILIYATCSYSAAEDEKIVAWLQEKQEMASIPLQVLPEWNIVTTKGNGTAYGYRFYPDRVRGEGFFLAVLQKQGTATAAFNDGSPSRQTTAEKKAAAMLQQWLDAPLQFVAEKEDWLALPPLAAAHLPLLKKHLYLRKAGINMGRLIRNELVPGHELAVASGIAPGLPGMELTTAQALQYLRRQELTGIETPRNGWLLVRYGGLALGWIKAIGHRINNYYPTEWRILK